MTTTQNKKIERIKMGGGGGVWGGGGGGGGGEWGCTVLATGE